MKTRYATTKRARMFALFLSVALMAVLIPSAPAALAAGNQAVQLDGVNDGIQLGAAGSLGASQFTLELWFMRTGTGAVASTGTGGATSIIPLISKGRSESDGTTVDTNYMLGISTITGTGGGTVANSLAADFEDRTLTSNNNSPVFGATAITQNVWHHAAATFNGSQFCLYLDGALDGTCRATTLVPTADSVQIPAVGTAYNSPAGGNVAAGFFAGQVDEVRIWSTARSQAQIQASMNQELTSGTNLIGRWGLNEGSGNTATASVGPNATLVNGPTWVAGAPALNPPPSGNLGLQFDGSNDYVTFGQAPGLGAAMFTLETWFMRTGTGVTTQTGSGGLASAIPLITKGRNETDNSVVDMNYFLGIDVSTPATPRLAADFEEGSGGTTPGLNHPIVGTTTITSNVWHHAAATYDGATWTLYLDGVVNGTLSVGQPPQSNSTQHAALGTALDSTGASVGAFAGVLDEARIWNVARTSGEISAAMNQELTSGTGLIGHWGMNDGAGTTAVGTPGPNGTLTNGPTWVAGAPAIGTPPPPTGGFGVSLPGTLGSHVDLGASSSSLGATNFTLELWFKRTGAGDPASTSSSAPGLTSVIPLIAKGRSEADGSSVDVNYFLGIDSATGRLAADFEEGPGGTTPGANHGFIAPTVVPMDVWTHAAVTYDGSVFRIYLNGVLDGTSPAINQPPQSNSIHRVGLGTTFNSGGTADGAFAGVIDEARIWNIVRTGTEINSAKNTEINAATGLIGRWGMNEGTGTTTVGSVGGVNGSLVGSASWAAGAPLDVGDAPDAPVVVGPTDGATNVTLPPTLDVTVTDPDSANVDVTFFGRPAGGAGAGADFTLMTIPDTQWYSENIPNTRNAIYTAQMNWIVSSQASLNTVFVTHLGDMTQNYDTVEAEWQRASDNQAILDSNGVRNGVNTGNHDFASSGSSNVAHFFDQYFPPSRYQGFPWYGGYLGDPTDGVADGGFDRLNKDNYALFSAGGMDFLVIQLEHDMPSYATAWAQNLIDAYPNRHVIISTHAFVNASGQRGTSPISRTDGQSAQAVWTNLIAPNCEIFMVVNGHYHGAGRRTDNNSCGQPVFQLNSDYQDLPNGGDGYLRYYTFKPSEDKIYATTYSPTLNSFDSPIAEDAFTLDWDMAGAAQFTQIGTVQDVASGEHATIQWNGLSPNTEYEWYAVVSDGSQSTDGPTSSFTTETPPPAPPVVDSVTINQANPRTNDTLTVAVTSHDVNNDPITYQYQWVRNGSDIGGQTGATLNLATAGNGNKGDTIAVRVTANDGSANSAPLTSGAVTILNSVPTATVGLSPTTPQATQTVTATATRADVDTDSVTLTYVWKINGAVVKTTPATSSLTDTLDLSTTSASNGNTLSVEVTPNDGTANGTMASAEVTIDVPTVSAIPDSTFQVSGQQTVPRVNAILRVGNVVYIGGDFTVLLGHDGESVPRQYLAALDANTGQPLPWNPGADGIVHSLAASPDGSIVYAGGAFRNMGGLTRTRLAAINATTGAVLNWAPNASGIVRTIMTSGNNVYVGGSFAFLTSQPRAGLGVINATTAAIGSWAPTPSGGGGAPHDMLMTPDGRVIVVGTFTTMNTVASPYIAALDATTGAILPWAGHPSHPSQGISQSPGRVFIATGNGSGGNQVISYDIANGNQLWAQTGDGDVVAVEYLNGVVYAGGHFDNMAGQPRGRLAAFDPTTGTMRNWTPSVNTAVAIVTMTSGGGKLFIGGAFTVVSGLTQQRYASFSGAPAPNTPPVVDSVVIDQASPGTNATLSATVVAHDPDGNPLTYAYQWTRNGTDIVGATTATLDMSVANRGDKGDLIRLRVTANDGLVDSPAVTSAPVTVANTLPTATVALSTQSPGTNTILTATATRADADAGDTVTLTYLWTVNGTTRQTTTTTNLTDTFDLSVAGNGDPGDSVVVTVTPNDGTANGSGVSSTATVASGATPPIFADEFANLNNWINVTRITIDNALGSPAVPSARAVASNQTAFAYRDLGTSTMTPCVSMNVTVASGTGVDLFRLRSAGNGAVIKVFVHANGTLQLRSDFGGTTRNSGVQVGTGWHSLELCGTVGSNTTWDLIRDGVVIINDWQADTGTAAVNRIQIGDSAAKTFTANFDHVRVDLVPGEAGGGGDTEGPTTPGTPTGSSPSAGTIQISWTASTDASPPITYRVYRDGNPTSIGQTTSTTFNDPGLTPGTTHTYRVDAVDSLNNPSLMSGTSASILVSSPPDTQGPTTPGTPTGSSPSAGMIQIQWTASTDASPPITYRIYRDGNPTSIGQTTSLTFMDPGLTPGTNHTYTVDAVDSLNNPSLMSGTSASITVSAPSDTEGPTTPGTPTGSSPSNGTIQISWSASTDASPPITYRVYRDGNPTSIGQTTSTSFNDPGLTPGTSHTYTVDAVDNFNNPSSMSGVSASITVTGPLADTQGPTTPGTPTGASPSNGMIQIQWTASTDASPPITYRVYRDGNPTSIGQTTSLTFMDPGLTPGTGHTYTVDAVDSLNNPSLMSGTSASILVSGGAPPAIFEDDFSSGNFVTQWTSVTRMTIDAANGSSAAPSARASVTNQSAFAYRDLSTTTMTPCLSVNVNVASGTGVDLLRLRSAGNGALIKVFVHASGTLQIRSDFAGTTRNSNVQVGTGWHSIELCGTVGTNTTWDLIRDGVVIIDNWQANTGTDPVARVQIGDSAAKTFTANFDNVRLDQVAG